MNELPGPDGPWHNCKKYNYSGVFSNIMTWQIMKASVRIFCHFSSGRTRHGGRYREVYMDDPTYIFV